MEKRPTFESSPSEVIKESRLIKGISKDEEIRLNSPSKEGAKVENQAIEVMESMAEEQKDWVAEKKQELLGQLEGVDETELMSAFERGLKTFMRQQVKLFSEVSPKAKVTFDEQYLRDAVFAYTFDFILSARNAIRRGVNPKSALKIAKRSYRNDPDFLTQLTKKFPDLDSGVVTIAASSYPLSAEKFLKEVQKTIPELQEKFPDMDLSIIKRAAVNHPNEPEEFLEKVTEEIKNLTKQFPSESPTVIKSAAQTKNSEEFMKRFQKEFTRLTAEFPDLGKWVINLAILNHSGPDEFIDKFKISIIDLKKEFPEASNRLIKKAAISYSKPDKYIIESLARVQKIKLELPEEDEEIIQEAIIEEPIDPRIFIKKVREAIIRLKVVAKDSPDWMLRKVALSSPDKAEEVFLNVQNLFLSLKEKHPTIDERLIVDAILEHSTETEEYLSKLSVT